MMLRLFAVVACLLPIAAFKNWGQSHGVPTTVECDFSL